MRAFLCLVLLAMPASADQITGRAKIVDGDTVSFSVRLFGIDTPERRQRCERAGVCYACGRAATRYMIVLTTRQAVGRRTWRNVTCQFTGDYTHGRPVAVCRSGGRDLGEAIIRAGWALAYRRFLDQRPNLRERYLAAEANAKRNGRGLHSGRFLKPWRWRRGERLACEQR